MAFVGSVVKASYFKGATRFTKAGAHINYIQYRKGEDRENGGPRKFFDDSREGISGRQVKRDLATDGGKYVHKIILSPGYQEVDMKAYTRGVMANIGRAKGVDLNWRAVEHHNTDHVHAHVVVFGMDKFGKEVQFDRDDYALMREFGDRYLEHNHEFERYLDKDLHQLMKAPDYSVEGDRKYVKLMAELFKGEDPDPVVTPYEARPWNKAQAREALPEPQRVRVGDDTYTKYSSIKELKEVTERLSRSDADIIASEKQQMLRTWLEKKETAGAYYYEKEAREKWDKKERKKEQKERKQLDDATRDFDKIDRDMANTLKRMQRSGEAFGKGHKQILREAQGAFGPAHAHYTAMEEIKRLQDEAAVNPARAAAIEAEIRQIREWDKWEIKAGKWEGLEKLLGSRYEREAKELAQLVAPREVPLPMWQPGGSEELSSEARSESELAKSPERETDKGAERKTEAELPAGEAKVPELTVEAESRADIVKADNGNWQELDSMLGDRYAKGYDERSLTKESQLEKSQSEMRQFQDSHISTEQTPQLSRDDIERDDGEDLFSQGIVR